MFSSLTPPTDSLYKFIAISGIVIILSSVYFLNSRLAEIHEESFSLVKEKNKESTLRGKIDYNGQILEKRIKSYYNKIKKVYGKKENFTVIVSDTNVIWSKVIDSENHKEIDAETESIQRMIDERIAMSIQIDELEAVNDAKTAFYEEKNKIYNIVSCWLYGLIVFGLVTMLFGFGLWYSKLQRYQDAILEKQYTDAVQVKNNDRLDGSVVE